MLYLVLSGVQAICWLTVLLLLVRRGPKSPAVSVGEVEASAVREGHQVVEIAGERLRSRGGVYPTVSAVETLLVGEGGNPTVYVETEEKPGWTWCLRPDETVIVVKTS